MAGCSASVLHLPLSSGTAQSRMFPNRPWPFIKNDMPPPKKPFPACPGGSTSLPPRIARLSEPQAPPSAYTETLVLVTILVTLAKCLTESNLRKEGPTDQEEGLILQGDPVHVMAKVRGRKPGNHTVSAVRELGVSRSAYGL